jgi:hypothetical protein
MFCWCMRGRRQRSAQRKGCTCIQVGTIDGVNTDTDDPAFSTPGDLSAIPAQVFANAWYDTVPGFTAPAKSTGCSFVSTVFPSSLQSIVGSGTQRFCQCAPTQAGINLAVSGTVTASSCSPVPKGYTQIPTTNGQPVTTPSPKPTTTPTTLASTPPPPSKSSSTSSCNLAWCGAPFRDPTCGLRRTGKSPSDFDNTDEENATQKKG